MFQNIILVVYLYLFIKFILWFSSGPIYRAVAKEVYAEYKALSDYLDLAHELDKMQTEKTCPKKGTPEWEEFWNRCVDVDARYAATGIENPFFSNALIFKDVTERKGGNLC